MTTKLNLETSFDSLAAWCRAKNYAGFDPFDGLNSRLFQATPLINSRLCRLVWTQLFKRSPVNFRRLALVPEQENAKGIALFALAHLSRFRAVKTIEHEREARFLLDKLLEMRVSANSSSAWGYNFDWQGRSFFAPRGTPMIVPTAFAVRALLEGFEVFGDDIFRQTARSACDFILQDLRRTHDAPGEICFSYSPIDRTQVYNASLLAAEVLATTALATGERELQETAVKAARFVVRRQRKDGSWAYGTDDFQSWADNFHTAFVLFSLKKIVASDENARAEFSAAIAKGYEFWTRSFFLENGLPKYFHDRAFPIDCHSSGAGIVALCELAGEKAGAIELAEKIASWTVGNLRNERGFFYYQKRRAFRVKIPYLRWTQSWMLYALARLIEEKAKGEK